jgi:two-component system nitrogen regulation sensor histidine kinase NtrY
VATAKPLTGSRPAITPAAAQPARRPFRDNPPLILAGVIILLAALGGIVWLADRTSTLSPDFLTEVVLIALSVTNVTMLLALVFVLARNVIKSLVEGRRGLPFGRFRAKLVLAILAMTVIPSVLVMIVGSRVVLTAVDRWFNAPMEQILSGANFIASDYYQQRQQLVLDQASRIAESLAAIDLAAAEVSRVQRLVTPGVTGRRVGMVQVYRVVRQPGLPPEVVSVVDVASPSMPRGRTQLPVDPLATRVATGDEAAPSRIDEIAGGGDLLHVATAVRNTAGQITGVVVASEYLSGQFAEQARNMSKAYEDYSQLRVLKQPLAGVYVSFFVMVTLLILVGSTWMGLYLAKRITRPVQLLSEAAKEIAAGHYDQRIEHEGHDEFGSMIEAFNVMAAEISQQRKRLERAGIDLERKHEEGEGRRRYIEAILERIATGVVSIDRAGRIGTMNPSALRLLELGGDVVGASAVDVFARPDLTPINDVLDQAARAKMDSFAQEVALVRDGRERHVVAAATRVAGTDGSFDGTVLVVDDVTPLIRAQKVAAWR